jgi:UDP-N-acetylglucosamine:LPS N-acetylglucosamine transferase
MAVADELRASGAEVSFLGTRERIEADLVPAAGYEIDFLKVRGIDRGSRARAALAGVEAAAAVGTALRVLWRRRPDVVLGGGGFVAGPAGLAAVLARVPLVLSEADSRLGLANRLLAGRARRVCLAFPIAGREGERYVVTGRPIPPAVLSADRSTSARSPPSPSARGGASTSSTSPAGATSRCSRSGSPRLRATSATRCSPTSPTSATAWRPATWCWGAPEDRSSS